MTYSYFVSSGKNVMLIWFTSSYLYLFVMLFLSVAWFMKFKSLKAVLKLWAKPAEFNRELGCSIAK